jgi:hypothetical protein
MRNRSRPERSRKSRQRFRSWPTISSTGVPATGRSSASANFLRGFQPPNTFTGGSSLIANCTVYSR